MLMSMWSRGNDTRLLIHVQDALVNECNNYSVRTVNTDVVVILVGKFHHLSTYANTWITWFNVILRDAIWKSYPDG